MSRRSSSSSSGSSTARDEGNHPSTAQIRNTAFHSFPFALCTVLRTSESDSDSLPPARSCVLEGGSSASAARNAVARRIARGDRSELIEIGQASFGSIVLLLEHGVVDRADRRDVARDARTALLALRRATPRSCRRSVASDRWASRARGGAMRCVKASGSQARSCMDVHERARGRVADPRHQHEDAIPAHLVARIVGHPQEREDVLHVRRLEELEPAPLLERDLAVGQLDLEIGRHVAGPEQHRHLAERHAPLVQLRARGRRRSASAAPRPSPSRARASRRPARVVQRSLVNRSSAREISVLVSVEDRLRWSGSSGRG